MVLFLASQNLQEKFLKSGLAFDSRRKTILPSNFKTELFLHTNSNLWIISDVGDMVTEIDFELI